MNGIDALFSALSEVSTRLTVEDGAKAEADPARTAVKSAAYFIIVSERVLYRSIKQSNRNGRAQ